MNAPEFWYAQKTPAQFLLKCALKPASWLYGWLVRKKFDLTFPIPMAKPVICVGNIVAGGAGKTPTVLALTALLQERGFNPHILTLGYGGAEEGPLQVAPSRDTAEDVGDEALLLVERAPTWVAKRRVAGAQSAMESGADIVVMDDGYQNGVIYKDLSLVVVDGGAGFGNRAVMPAGPLRESLAFGLSRADAALIIGEDKTNAEALVKKYRPDLPILRGELVPDAENPVIKDKNVFAFAGIGRPAKFRETLEEAGARVEGWAAFPDHHPYEIEDLREIAEAAEKHGVPLVTTAKDHVRLPASLKGRVLKFGVHLALRDPAALMALIDRALKKR